MKVWEEKIELMELSIENCKKKLKIEEMALKDFLTKLGERDDIIIL